MKRLMTACLLLALAGSAPTLLARKKDEGTPMPAVDASAFDAQRKDIVHGFGDGERYAEISSDDKTKVLASLDRMDALLGDSTSIDALRSDDKVALYNEQETVNTILTKAQQDSREVCKRSRPVNSRIAVNECRTVAEWQRKRDESRDLLDQNQKHLTRPILSRGPNPDI